MRRQGRIKERDVLVILGTMLLFLWLNFSPELGAIYLGMVLLSYTIYNTDNKVSLFLEKHGSSWVFSFLLACATYAFFILFSGIILGIVSPNYLVTGEDTFSMVARTMATTTPVLAGSFLLSVFAWGFLVAIIETDFFFGKFLEWVCDTFGIPINFKLKSGRAWLLIISLSFIFALFHMSVKGVTNNQALVLTFLFAVISSWLVFATKETKTAIMFHVISNSIAVMNAAGRV